MSILKLTIIRRGHRPVSLIPRLYLLSGTFLTPFSRFLKSDKQFLQISFSKLNILNKVKDNYYSEEKNWNRVSTTEYKRLRWTPNSNYSIQAVTTAALCLLFVKMYGPYKCTPVHLLNSSKKLSTRDEQKVLPHETRSVRELALGKKLIRHNRWFFFAERKEPPRFTTGVPSARYASSRSDRTFSTFTAFNTSPRRMRNFRSNKLSLIRHENLVLRTVAPSGASFQ